MISACIMIPGFTDTAVWDPKASQLELRRSRFLDPGIHTFWHGVSNISDCQTRLKASERDRGQSEKPTPPHPTRVFRARK